jgi:hypothetical protein
MGDGPHCTGPWAGLLKNSKRMQSFGFDTGDLVLFRLVAMSTYINHLCRVMPVLVSGGAWGGHHKSIFSTATRETRKWRHKASYPF